MNANSVTHPTPPFPSFRLRISVPDRADNLVIDTPDGVHTFDLIVERHRAGEMEITAHLNGSVAADGSLEVAVFTLSRYAGANGRPC